MKLAGKTDVGSVRPENQDDYRAGELNSDAAWGLVCDGMGGARGGREASMSACDVIEHSFHEQYAQCLPGDEEKFLKRALTGANRFVFQKASREEELAGMGTTAVCALVRGGNAFICHAGDSRAYLVRDGKLTQLTHEGRQLGNDGIYRWIRTRVYLYRDKDGDLKGYTLSRNMEEITHREGEDELGIQLDGGRG